MKKAIFFDLDYTLFDTEDYYSAGLKAVSEYLESENSVDSSVTFEFLLGLWKEKTSRYASLFDDVIEKFNLEVDAKKLVEIFIAKKNIYFSFLAFRVSISNYT